MQEFQRIIDGNRRWAAESKAADPTYFTRLLAGQQPHFLYIGCADSRVPFEVVTGAAPGELFVHRNIANVVLASDLNAMSVVQYAVEVLDVRHIIVCGHYGCGGVKAAMSDQPNGLVDHWLGHIRSVLRRHQPELDALADDERRLDRAVELNVVEQIYHLAESPVVQRAWARGPRPMLHGLVYDMHEGLLRELVTGVDSQVAAERLAARRASGVPAGRPPLLTVPTTSGTPHAHEDARVDPGAEHVGHGRAAGSVSPEGG